MDIKFCKDCKHYRTSMPAKGGGSYPNSCVVIPSDLVLGSEDLVIGEEKPPSSRNAYHFRENSSGCGIEAKYFDPEEN